MVVAKRPDGRWNLGALVRRERRENQQSGPGRPIHILSIGLVDAEVVIKDPLTLGAAHVPSHFEELNAEAARIGADVDRFFDQSLRSEPDGRERLFEAMRQIARTGQGPREQIPSIGCSIKWKAA